MVETPPLTDGAFFKSTLTVLGHGLLRREHIAKTSRVDKGWQGPCRKQHFGGGNRNSSCKCQEGELEGAIPGTREAGSSAQLELKC